VAVAFGATALFMAVPGSGGKSVASAVWEDGGADNKRFLEELSFLCFPPNCAAQRCLSGIE